MKNIPALCYALACITIISISCRYNDNGNTNISYSESLHYYSMKAHFSTEQTCALKDDQQKPITNNMEKTFSVSL